MRPLVLLVSVLILVAVGIGLGILSPQHTNMLLLATVFAVLNLWWQQRFWCAETLLLCDRPRDDLRGIIALAVARWATGRLMRFRVVSDTPAGVVLEAPLAWLSGGRQRIAITAEAGSIRVLSEATLPRRREGWENIAAVREQMSRTIEWAQERSGEEIDRERQRWALGGTA